MGRQVFVFKNGTKRVTTNIGCGFVAVVEQTKDDVSVMIKKENHNENDIGRNCRCLRS